MRWRHRLPAGLGLAVLLAAGALVAGASSPLVGSNLRVTDALAVGGDSCSSVAWSSKAEEYVVVWMDGRNIGAGGSWDIYGQRLTAEGKPVGGNFRISDGPADRAETGPSIAWNDGAGGFLVVWHDNRNAPGLGVDIYGQVLGADGTPVGANFRISSGTSATDEVWPMVVANPDTPQYLVVWQDDRSRATRGTDVYAQRLAPDGSRVGGAVRVSGAGAVADDRYPSAAWNDSAHQYLVVWDDDRNAATRGSDVFAQVLDAEGVLVGRNFRLSGPGAVADERNPKAVWSDWAGQYLVVWADGRHEATRGRDVFGQLVGSGGPVGGNFRISGPGARTEEFYPAAAWDASAGRFLVVWEDERNYATRGWDVFGQYLSAGGAEVGANFRISGPAATGGEHTPAVTNNPTRGEHLVTWEDSRNWATHYWDIYGQRLAG